MPTTSRLGAPAVSCAPGSSGVRDRGEPIYLNHRAGPGAGTPRHSHAAQVSGPDAARAAEQADVLHDADPVGSSQTRAWPGAGSNRDLGGVSATAQRPSFSSGPGSWLIGYLRARDVGLAAGPGARPAR